MHDLSIMGEVNSFLVRYVTDTDTDFGKLKSNNKQKKKGGERAGWGGWRLPPLQRSSLAAFLRRREVLGSV